MTPHCVRVGFFLLLFSFGHVGNTRLSTWIFVYVHKTNAKGGGSSGCSCFSSTKLV